MKIKIIILLVVSFLLFGMGTTIYMQNNKLEKLRTELMISNQNIAAFEEENNSLKDKNLVFQYSIDQLEHSNDSLVKEMNRVRKELKIKDKELKEMAYLASIAERVDTIYLQGEPIKENIDIREKIEDEWYTLDLRVKSPNIVSVKPTFVSEKYIMYYIRKETINPSKCKFVNFFRKKQEVLEVEVFEKNPYIINSNQKFINKL